MRDWSGDSSHHEQALYQVKPIKLSTKQPFVLILTYNEVNWSQLMDIYFIRLKPLQIDTKISHIYCYTF